MGQRDRHSRGSGCAGRTHKGRARTIGQLCCSIARKRVLYLVRQIVAERPGREAGLRYSAGRAQRGRGRSIDHNAVRRHARTTRPCGFSRQGRGKRVRENSEREASSKYHRGWIYWPRTLVRGTSSRISLRVLTICRDWERPVGSEPSPLFLHPPPASSAFRRAKRGDCPYDPIRSPAVSIDVVRLHGSHHDPTGNQPLP